LKVAANPKSEIRAKKFWRRKFFIFIIRLAKRVVGVSPRAIPRKDRTNLPAKAYGR